LEKTLLALRENIYVGAVPIVGAAELSIAFPCANAPNAMTEKTVVTNAKVQAPPILSIYRAFLLKG
jgi:hypothetical protein